MAARLMSCHGAETDGLFESYNLQLTGTLVHGAHPYRVWCAVGDARRPSDVSGVPDVSGVSRPVRGAACRMCRR